MNIKKGDVLKAKNGYGECTVLGIVDGLYFMSKRKEKNGTEFLTLEGLKETFELPEEKWVPKEGQIFFLITSEMTVDDCSFFYKETIDKYSSVGNCFPTKEAAEAKLAEVLAVLKN